MQKQQQYAHTQAHGYAIRKSQLQNKQNKYGCIRNKQQQQFANNNANRTTERRLCLFLHYGNVVVVGDVQQNATPDEDDDYNDNDDDGNGDVDSGGGGVNEADESAESEMCNYFRRPAAYER